MNSKRHPATPSRSLPIWLGLLMMLSCGVAQATSIGQPNASLVVDSSGPQLNLGSSASSAYQYFDVIGLFDSGLPTFGNTPGSFLSLGNTMNIPTWNPTLLLQVSNFAPSSDGLNVVTSSQQQVAPEPGSVLLVACGLLGLSWRCRGSAFTRAGS